MASQIRSQDLVFHFLNVGFGDTAVIELPPDKSGKRLLGVVDCRSGKKTYDYIKELKKVRAAKNIPVDGVAFICATHPHFDHVSGIEYLMKKPETCPVEFWDSGFRHNLATYQRILKTVYDKGIRMKRVSSGMEWYFGKLRITALAPSVALRNRYATYGVDMNNASIVLRFENGKRDVVIVESERYVGNQDPIIARKASQSIAILMGDAEFDTWAYVSQEYPKVEGTSKHKPLVKKMLNLLKCHAVKVAHHGSMHSAPLDVYEKMSPSLGIISTEQEESEKKVNWGVLKRHLFPHSITEAALEETDSCILTTDGSYETDNSRPFSHPGTIVLVVPPGGRPRFTKLKDTAKQVPKPPHSV